MAGRYVLPEDSPITVSREAARKLLGSGSGDAALLYIHILVNGGQLEESDAAREIHRSESQVETALEVLRRLGLVASPDKPPAGAKLQRAEEPPQYTQEDIQREIKAGGEFARLVSEVQRALGSTLSSESVMTLFRIYDYLGLPQEVIYQLVSWCISEYQGRYGPGRMPSMRYIEKEAFVWEREGVFSIEAALDYIKRQNSLRSKENELIPALDLKGRMLSPSERRYLDSWISMGFGRDAVDMAYDRTVLNTGKLTWKYMDSILHSWHSKGLHTEAEINAGDAPPQFKKPPASHRQPQPEAASSPATARELEAMRAALEQLKGQ